MIGGNISVKIQVKDSSQKNAIGSRETLWTDKCELSGFLDYSSGQNSYSDFNAKIQETTHIFLCDYNSCLTNITSENARMIIKNQAYQILMIDDPMELHQHIEFYLKYIGGGQGVG